MRLLFGCLAVFLGAVSIALAARYGYKGADTIIDGVISAVVFGSIALCAFIFDAAAVRLWFMRHHVGAVVIGVIAAAALVVTFTNSLGAIAARGDTTQAERRKAKTDSAADLADLKRIARERDAMVFTPVTAEVVKAAQDAVRSAEEIRQRECGAGDPRQRGPNCRQRETEEQAKRDALTAVLANKALTDRAAKLDQDAETRARQARQGAAGREAEPARGHSRVAAGRRRCGADGLAAGGCRGGVRALPGRRDGDLRAARAGCRRPGDGPRKADPDDRQPDREPIPVQAVAKPSPSPSGRTRPKSAPTLASVKAFIGERVSPADGERVEMKSLVQEYRTWCAGKGSGPVDLESFLEEVERVCRKVGIEIVNDAQRVFCLNVKIDAAESRTRLALAKRAWDGLFACPRPQAWADQRLEDHPAERPGVKRGGDAGIAAYCTNPATALTIAFPFAGFLSTGASGHVFDASAAS